jgi:hypothetical protein
MTETCGNPRLPSSSTACMPFLHLQPAQAPVPISSILPLRIALYLSTQLSLLPVNPAASTFLPLSSSCSATSSRGAGTSSRTSSRSHASSKMMYGFAPQFPTSFLLSSSSPSSPSHLTHTPHISSTPKRGLMTRRMLGLPTATTANRKRKRRPWPREATRRRPPARAGARSPCTQAVSSLSRRGVVRRGCGRVAVCDYLIVCFAVGIFSVAKVARSFLCE